MPTAIVDRPSIHDLIAMRGQIQPPTKTVRETLAERFILPPFSVLNAREGEWQKRKRAWIDLGIKSELGRGEKGMGNGRAIKGTGAKARSFACAEWMQEKTGDTRGDASGTSIFDPALCEVVYRWWSPKGGMILDPFAGGSVRGIVAALTGRAYAGVDLRPEQIAANEAQRESICPGADLRWAVGDALDIESLLPDEYDFVFSCPPYFDLERYSDDPRDLSTMNYKGFVDTYKRIIKASCSMLKMDRFACFVVGNVRNSKTGNYYDLVGETISAFRAAGLELYNEAVLVTAVGSLPIRVGYQFAQYRKLGKTHQNVLMFVKGDAGRASAQCGSIDNYEHQMPALKDWTVAVCRNDLDQWVKFKEDITEDVVVLDMPLIEACLLVDVARGHARTTNESQCRAWVAQEGTWKKAIEGVELTYLVGGKPYLNREVFPDAEAPKGTAVPPTRLRGAP